VIPSMEGGCKPQGVSHPDPSRLSLTRAKDGPHQGQLGRAGQPGHTHYGPRPAGPGPAPTLDHRRDETIAVYSAATRTWLGRGPKGSVSTATSFSWERACHGERDSERTSVRSRTVGSEICPCNGERLCEPSFYS
jgi:hypothetical protein